MEQNVINLVFDNTISGLAGYEYGNYEYKKQLEEKMDYNKLNIIVFPDNIKKIAISFVQGMFAEILKKVNKDEIEKYIEIESPYEKVKQKVWYNIKF